MATKAKTGRKQKSLIKTRYGVFTCIFEREPDMGGYVAQAQGLQGAISWGKNLGEAKRMIAESIEGAVEAHAIVEAEKQGTVRILRTPKRPVLT